MEYLIELILPFLSSNPHLAVVLTLVSVSRAIFKPLCSLVQVYVDSTPGDSDNKKWQAFQESKAYKAISYFMDLFLSIKLPKK